MHQLDNLCSLIRESSSEERSRLTRMGSSNSSSRDLSIESFLLSNAESSRLPLVQRRGCENNASLEASIVKDFDKASFKTKSGKRAAEINIRRKMSVDKQTEIKQPWIFEGLQAPPNLVCCADAISTGEKKKETSWPLAKD
ncbi:hypothetical protein Bca4012_071637 [Brassica carinata]